MPHYASLRRAAAHRPHQQTESPGELAAAERPAAEERTAKLSAWSVERRMERLSLKAKAAPSTLHASTAAFTRAVARAAGSPAPPPTAGFSVSSSSVPRFSFSAEVQKSFKSTTCDVCYEQKAPKHFLEHCDDLSCRTAHNLCKECFARDGMHYHFCSGSSCDWIHAQCVFCRREATHSLKKFAPNGARARLPSACPRAGQGCRVVRCVARKPVLIHVCADSRHQERSRPCFFSACASSWKVPSAKVTTIN